MNEMYGVYTREDLSFYINDNGGLTLFIAEEEEVEFRSIKANAFTEEQLTATCIAIASAYDLAFRSGRIFGDLNAKEEIRAALGVDQHRTPADIQL